MLKNMVYKYNENTNVFEFKSLIIEVREKKSCSNEGNNLLFLIA